MSPGTVPPLRLLAWGALGVALHIGLARFGYGVVLPSLRVELALGYTAAGAMNAIHLGGYLVATLIAPVLARRFGMVRLAVGAHLLVAAGAVACALAPDGSAAGLAVLGAGRLATGLGAGAAVLAIMVTVLGTVAESARSTISVVLWAGMTVAVVGCGLAASALLAAGGWRMQFAVAAALAVALAALSPRGAAPAAADGGAGFTLAAVATRRWIWLVATYFCFGVGYIAYATFAGARLAASAATPQLAAIAWTTLGVAMLAGSALTIALLTRPRLRSYALAAAMGSAAAGSAVAGVGGSTASLAGAVLVGLGMVATPALITAAARTRSGAADYARAFSVATAALGLGQLAGPVLAGALADAFGGAAALLVAATAYGLGAVCAAVDRKVSAST